MNKIKLKFLCAVLSCVAVAPAMAETTTELRTDCTEIQSRISELATITEPDDATKSELAQLQAVYRRDCSKPAAGRRTIGRVSMAASATPVAATATVAATPETVVVTVANLLNDYLDQRRDLCAELSDDIEMLADNNASDAELEPLQNQYKADCEDVDHSKTVDIDPEVAAANVARGLCTDGSKPNEYGCCDGERFTDMGNLVFACCPEDGGECYPPINSGTKL